MSDNGNKYGKIVQVIGPVVDVAFEDDHLPEIFNAVRITDPGTQTGIPIDLICEVEQHLGELLGVPVAVEVRAKVGRQSDDGTRHAGHAHISATSCRHNSRTCPGLTLGLRCFA